MKASHHSMKMSRWGVVYFFMIVSLILAVNSQGATPAGKKINKSQLQAKKIKDSEVRRVLSSNEVNALVFDQPIISLYYPEGQILKNSAGKEQITYSSDQHALIFLLNAHLKKEVQFMVMLAHGSVQSLHFLVKKARGQVIYISTPVLDKFGDKHEVKNFDYESQLVGDLQFFILHHHPTAKWMKQIAKTAYWNPWGKDIDIVEQQQWQSSHQQLQRWKICSKSQFILKITPLIQDPQLKASWVEKSYLSRGECAQVLVIKDKDTSLNLHPYEGSKLDRGKHHLNQNLFNDTNQSKIKDITHILSPAMSPQWDKSENASHDES